MADPENHSRAIPLPHPDDIAARKALAAQAPAPLERILKQAAASRRWNTAQLRESQAKHPLNESADKAPN